MAAGFCPLLDDWLQYLQGHCGETRMSEWYVWTRPLTREKKTCPKNMKITFDPWHYPAPKANRNPDFFHALRSHCSSSKNPLGVLPTMLCLHIHWKHFCFSKEFSSVWPSSFLVIPNIGIRNSVGSLQDLWIAWVDTIPSWSCVSMSWAEQLQCDTKDRNPQNQTCTARKNLCIEPRRPRRKMIVETHNHDAWKP